MKRTALALTLSVAVLSQEACGGSEVQPDSPFPKIRQAVKVQCNQNFPHVADGLISQMPIERPARSTHWTIASSITSEILHKIDDGEKVFLIIGNESCAPCDAAEQWWSVRSTGPYQTYHVKIPDEQWDTFDNAGLFYGLPPNAHSPVCLLIERKDPQKPSPRHETVVKSTWGFPRCTGLDNDSGDENQTSIAE